MAQEAEDAYLIPVAAVSGFTAVALGAFGAHALRDRLSPEMMSIWHTGVEYHLAHSVMAVLTGVLLLVRPFRFVRVAGWLFLLGNAIFGGSLYVLALTETRAMGAITPLGGLSYLLGWLCLGFGASAKQPREL